MEVSASSSRGPESTGRARWQLPGKTGVAKLATVIVIAGPVAVWLLIGYLSEGGGTDHILEVPQLSRPAEIVAGIVAALVVVAAVAALVRQDRAWLIAGGWWRVYGRLLAAGVLVAVGGRIVTAGSAGANIGGGAILLLGPVPLLYLLARAHEEAVKIRTGGQAGWMPSAAEWLVAGLANGLTIVLAGALATYRRRR